MCFVYSGFQKSASLAKVKSSKMAWWSYYFKNGYFGIKFLMACKNHFCFIKIKVMSRFYFTISRGQSKFRSFTKNREN